MPFYAENVERLDEGGVVRGVFVEIIGRFLDGFGAGGVPN